MIPMKDHKSRDGPQENLRTTANAVTLTRRRLRGAGKEGKQGGGGAGAVHCGVWSVGIGV